MSTVRKRLGEMLIEAGIIDDTQLHAALGHQKQWGGRLGQALVDLRLVTEQQIVDALAVKFGYEAARLEGLEPYALSQALKLVPREFAVKNNVFPMAADTGTLTVATSDPANVTVADELRFRTGRRVKICVGGDRAIADAVRKHYPTAGEVQAIALDLDGGDPGEAVLDAFGGGSRDALEAFFGAPQTAPAAAPPPAGAPPPAPAAPAPAASPPAALALELEDAPRPRPPPLPAEVEAARAEHLGTIPHAGFTADPEEITAIPIEDLVTPAPRALAAATAAPPAAGEGSAEGQRELTDAELRVLDAIDRLAQGDGAQATVVKPDQVLAALVRLLIKRRIITEAEFVQELLGR